jgi:hypothetical protein
VTIFGLEMMVKSGWFSSFFRQFGFKETLGYVHHLLTHKERKYVSFPQVQCLKFNRLLATKLPVRSPQNSDHCVENKNGRFVATLVCIVVWMKFFQDSEETIHRAEIK